MQKVIVHRLRDDAKIPRKATQGSAGYDVCADEDITLVPKKLHLIKTGISLDMPQDIYARLHIRSGLARRGITLSTGTSIIDSDYAGELKAVVKCSSSDKVKIAKGERFAQLVFEKKTDVELETEGNECNMEQHGAAPGERTDGFGSTGRF